MEFDYDLIIIGAGPAGLSFARSLADTPLRILMLEKAPESDLANPVFDGREIALTHRSVESLKHLGAWQRMPEADIAPLKQARVMNGADARYLGFEPETSGQEGLGYLVPNHLIRQALYAEVHSQANVELRTEQRVTGIRAKPEGITLQTDKGLNLHARLAVAADSRFSESRRMMGIPAEMRDFGKTMMVCRMNLEVPHEHIAWEWFDYNQTIALLPCNGNVASLVLTLPAQQIAELMVMDEDAFSRDMEARVRARWGRMQLAGTRHAYPLVGVYPDRFVTDRFAVIGDAAVGMHPVTAHGFNFGLLSQATLSAEIRSALKHGRDIGDASLLQQYEKAHRQATKPLYLATLAIVSLFTNDTAPARFVREAVLNASRHATPLKKLVSRQLSGSAGMLPPLPAPPGFHLIKKLFS